MPRALTLARLFVFSGLVMFISDSISAQVVIRERVEVDAAQPLAGPGPAVSHLGENLLPGQALVIWRAARGNTLWAGGGAVTYGGPISAVLFAGTLRPNGANPAMFDTTYHANNIAAGFIPYPPSDNPPYPPPYEKFRHEFRSDPGAEGYVAVSFVLERLEHFFDVGLPIGGETVRPTNHQLGYVLDFQNDIDVTVGCYPGQGATFLPCMEENPNTIKSAAFNLEFEIVGKGIQPLATHPPDVACGGSMPVAPRAMRADGTEGWWNYRWPVRVNGLEEEGEGFFRIGDAEGTELWSTYGEAYHDLWYVAPSCSEVTESLSFSYSLLTSGAGSFGHSITVLPEGPPQCFGDCPEPVVRLLRQNGDEVTEGYVMVSKVAPDQMFQTSNMDFPMPCTSNCTAYGNFDPDTFRPEVTGLVLGQTVEFKVEVLPWDGRAVDDIPEFESVRADAADADGTWRYRSVRELRLVSNGRPTQGAPGPSKYDDDPFLIADRDRQTILVALEDRVRVTTMINEAPGPVQEWQVGASAGNPDSNAVRRAQLSWTVAVGNDSAVPDVIADRLSEDWAQAGIYFRNVGSIGTLDVGGIRSVLSIQHERRRTITSSGGIIEFDVLNDQTGALLDHISQPYGPNTQIFTFARLIETELQTRGYAVEYILGPLRKHGERLLALEPTQPLRVANFQTSGEVEIEQYRIRTENAELPDFQIMALHAKDADDETIDVVATDARRLGGDRLGATIYEGSRFGNTIFLTK